MLACRACRRPLIGPDGCAICNPVRANLVTTEENAEEYPALSDVGSEAVAALQTILRDNRRLAKLGSDEEARSAANEMILKTTNSLSKLLESARKLQSDGLAAVRNMSFGERAALFADWYQGLPQSYRDKVRTGINGFESGIAQPLPQREQRLELPAETGS